MGFPAPDLVIENTTPYGVLIWTSYTGSSLTDHDVLDAVRRRRADRHHRGQRSGNCDVVTTTRTRTYLDGRQRRRVERPTVPAPRYSTPATAQLLLSGASATMPRRDMAG